MYFFWPYSGTEKLREVFAMMTKTVLATSRYMLFELHIFKL